MFSVKAIFPFALGKERLLASRELPLVAFGSEVNVAGEIISVRKYGWISENEAQIWKEAHFHVYKHKQCVL